MKKFNSWPENGSPPLLLCTAVVQCPCYYVRFVCPQISPAELRARASPTDAVTTGSSSQRRSDVNLQSANSSVCDGDDPEDLTINSGQNHGNNNQLRYGPGDVQQLHKYPTAIDLMDNYARTGGASGGALSPFFPSFAKDPGDKMSPYNNKAFLDSYLKALVETNSPLYYASKLAGDMIKHEIAADDAEYSSPSDEEDDDSVNNSPLALQAGKNWWRSACCYTRERLRINTYLYIHTQPWGTIM